MSETKNETITETMQDETTKKRHEYDAMAKKLLSRKEVIANILKYVVKEFKEYSIPEIISFLNGEPEIAVELVDDLDIPPNMDVAGSETVSETEGKRTFDIKFKIKIPKENFDIELIINIESQYDYSPGYILERRGIYYIARIISSQYNVEFTKSNFNNMKKVYSIWICTNAPKKVANTITEYSLSKKSIVGEVPDVPFNYDLMSLIMINLGSTDKNYSGLIKMLDLLLNKIISDREKALSTLENEFHIPFQSIKEEVDPMCNLSTGIYNNGLANGIAVGRTEGIAVGRTEGIAVGRTEGIAVGRIEGIAVGKTEGMITKAIEVVKNLIQNHGMKLETALTVADIDEETYNKYSKEN